MTLFGSSSDDERSGGEALFMISAFLVLLLLLILLLLCISLMAILMTAAHMGMVLDMESGKRFPLLVASTMMAPCECAA